MITSRTLCRSTFLLLTIGAALASCDAAPASFSSSTGATNPLGANVPPSIPIACDAATVHRYFVALAQHPADHPNIRAFVQQHETQLQSGAIYNLAGADSFPFSAGSFYARFSGNVFFGENAVLADAAAAAERRDFQQAQSLLQSAYCTFLAYADAFQNRNDSRRNSPPPAITTPQPGGGDFQSTIRKPETVKFVNLIAENTMRLGNLQAAERLLRAGLMIPLPESVYTALVAQTKRLLMQTLLFQGQTAEAKALLTEAIKNQKNLEKPVFDDVFDFENNKYGAAAFAYASNPSEITLNDMANLANIDEKQGDFTEAELNWDAVTVSKMQSLLNPSDIANVYSELAFARARHGEFQEAIRIEAGAIQLLQQVQWPYVAADKDQYGSLLLNLAYLNIYHANNAAALSPEEKMRLLNAAARALASAAASPGFVTASTSPQGASFARVQGLLEAARGNTTAAERDLLSAAATAQRVFAQDPQQMLSYFNDLGQFYITRGNAEAARSAFNKYKAALDIERRNPNNVDNGAAELNAVTVDLLENHSQIALANVRRLSSAVLRPLTENASLQTFTLGRTEQATLIKHLVAAAAQESPSPETATALADETFRLGQVLHNSAVGVAIGQMSARLASGNDAVDEALRERQVVVGAVSAARRDFDNILLGGPFQLDPQLEKLIPHQIGQMQLQKGLMDLSGANAGRGTGMANNVPNPIFNYVITPDILARRRRTIASQEALERLAIASSDLESIDTKLLADYPAYAELASPRPIGIADIQALLDPDEAMAVFITGRNNSLNLPNERSAAFVWLIRHNDSSFRQIKPQNDSLDHMIQRLRDSLDTESEQNQLNPGAPFPIGEAHLLYQSLFYTESDRLKGVRKLFIVADGALESLPFSTLATAPYTGAATDYAHMPWFGRQVATISLPSASALRALRRYAAKARPAPEPFTGYGNPSLNGPAPIRAAPQPHRDVLRPMRDAHVDVDALRQLPPLPESATELRAMARALDAPAEDVHVQNQATVPAVRNADLSRFRVIAFATHASVGGELVGVAEPAILLTPPPVATEDDDGLLRASTIARDLKLNADWVVLSACNTAAPDGTSGAPGLSGLAKAFFYAGAKALLVSNWSVFSESTTELTTATIREWSTNPSIGRAEALRRAEMQLLDHPSHPEYAHPKFWAPFVLAGEGGANR